MVNHMGNQNRQPPETQATSDTRHTNENIRGTQQRLKRWVTQIPPKNPHVNPGAYEEYAVSVSNKTSGVLLIVMFR
jgi:hypothetical protein